MRQYLEAFVVFLCISISNSCTVSRISDQDVHIVDARETFTLTDEVPITTQVECGGTDYDVKSRYSSAYFQVINAATLSVQFMRSNLVTSTLSYATRFGSVQCGPRDKLIIWAGNDTSAPPSLVVCHYLNIDLETGANSLVSPTGVFTIFWDTTTDLNLDFNAVTGQLPFVNTFLLQFVPISEITNCVCAGLWLGDGACDRVCNTIECGYDGGDCIGDFDPIHISMINPQPRSYGGILAGIPNTNEIRIFNPRTQFFTRFDEYNKERGIVAGFPFTIGPDGTVFTRTGMNKISKYDGVTGAYLGIIEFEPANLTLTRAAQLFVEEEIENGENITIGLYDSGSIFSPGNADRQNPLWVSTHFFVSSTSGKTVYFSGVAIFDEQGNYIASLLDQDDELELALNFKKVVFIPYTLNSRLEFIISSRNHANGNSMFSHCIPDFADQDLGCSVVKEFDQDNVFGNGVANSALDFTVTGDGHVLIVFDRERIAKMAPLTGLVKEYWTVESIRSSSPNATFSSWNTWAVAWGPDNKVYIGDFSAFVEPLVVTVEGKYDRILGAKQFGLSLLDFLPGPDPIQSRASLVGGNTVVAGEKVQIRLDAASLSGDPWVAGGAGFNVMSVGRAYIAQYDTDIELTLEADLSDTGGGVYIASFEPRAASVYSTRITLGHEQIVVTGSPIAFEAIPAETSATHSAYTLTSPLTATNGNSLSFSIIAKDRFLNERRNGGDEISIRVTFLQEAEQDENDFDSAPKDPEEIDVTLEVLKNLVLTDLENGVYTVNCTVARPGDYSLYLQMKNKKGEMENVGRSPIAFTVFEIPFDIRNVPTALNSTLTSIMGGLCGIGILIAIIFLIFNNVMAAKNNKIIKMSSHRINNVILFGSIIALVSVILQAAEEACIVRIWFINLSFTITFGALFAKTWRVHKLLNNKKLSKVRVKDSQLFSVLGFLVFIDVVFLLAWTLVSPVEARREALPLEDDEEDPMIKYRKIITTCTSDDFGMWLGLAVVMKASLLLVGVWLSVKTRNVQIAAMNDSKYIAMSIYNVVILLGPGVPITFYIDNIDAKYTLTAMEIFFVIITTISLLFVPKMIAIFQNEEEKWTDTSGTSTGDSSNTTQLENENKVLKSKLVNLEKEMNRLKLQAKSTQSAQSAPVSSENVNASINV